MIKLSRSYWQNKQQLKKSMNTYAQMLYLLSDVTVYEYKYKTA